MKNSVRVYAEHKEKREKGWTEARKSCVKEMSF